MQNYVDCLVCPILGFNDIFRHFKEHRLHSLGKEGGIRVYRAGKNRPNILVLLLLIQILLQYNFLAFIVLVGMF